MVYEIKSPRFINEQFFTGLCDKCPYCELIFECEKTEEYTSYILSCEYYDICKWVMENMDDSE